MLTSRWQLVFDFDELLLDDKKTINMLRNEEELRHRQIVHDKMNSCDTSRSIFVSRNVLFVTQSCERSRHTDITLAHSKCHKIYS